MICIRSAASSRISVIQGQRDGRSLFEQQVDKGEPRQHGELLLRAAAEIAAIPIKAREWLTELPVRRVDDADAQRARRVAGGTG